MVELGLKYRLSLSSPTFSVAHISYIACTPQSEDKHPWISCLKINSFTFKPLPQGPDKSRETEESQPINILSKHTHLTGAQMSTLCDKGFWAQQMNSCQTLLPCSTTASTLDFLYQVKSFHVTSTAVCLPANLLAGKPRSFLPVQPREEALMCVWCIYTQHWCP